MAFSQSHTWIRWRRTPFGCLLPWDEAHCLVGSAGARAGRLAVSPAPRRRRSRCAPSEGHRPTSKAASFQGTPVPAMGVGGWAGGMEGGLGSLALASPVLTPSRGEGAPGQMPTGPGLGSIPAAAASFLLPPSHGGRLGSQRALASYEPRARARGARRLSTRSPPGQPAGQPPVSRQDLDRRGDRDPCPPVPGLTVLPLCSARKDSAGLARAQSHSA